MKNEPASKSLLRETSRILANLIRGLRSQKKKKMCKLHLNPGTSSQ